MMLVCFRFIGGHSTRIRVVLMPCHDHVAANHQVGRYYSRDSTRSKRSSISVEYKDKKNIEDREWDEHHEYTVSTNIRETQHEVRGKRFEWYAYLMSNLMSFRVTTRFSGQKKLFSVVYNVE